MLDRWCREGEYDFLRPPSTAVREVNGKYSHNLERSAPELSLLWHAYAIYQRPKVLAHGLWGCTDSSTSSLCSDFAAQSLTLSTRLTVSKISFPALLTMGRNSFCLVVHAYIIFSICVEHTGKVSQTLMVLFLIAGLGEKNESNNNSNTFRKN